MPISPLNTVLPGERRSVPRCVHSSGSQGRLPGVTLSLTGVHGCPAFSPGPAPKCLQLFLNLSSRSSGSSRKALPKPRVHGNNRTTRGPGGRSSTCSLERHAPECSQFLGVPWGTLGGARGTSGCGWLSPRPQYPGEPVGGLPLFPAFPRSCRPCCSRGAMASASAQAAALSAEQAKVVLAEVIQAFAAPENAVRMDEARDIGQVIKAYGFSCDGEGVLKFARLVKSYEAQDPEIASLSGKLKALFLPPMTLPPHGPASGGSVAAS
ncbi:PREDICTED: protein C10 [Myotis davidii]|uniref:protein C10 n=1 Tax=Myotis davidii TaxID=225400 RepID=UPI000767543D|nr:PREDICTED: protein C10 [Myotis davidii]